MTSAALTSDHIAQPEPTQARYTLVREQTIALRPSTRTRLTCQYGTLWITIEGDIHDHFLSAGQTLICPTARLLVIEARSARAQLLVSGD